MASDFWVLFRMVPLCAYCGEMDRVFGGFSVSWGFPSQRIHHGEMLLCRHSSLRAVSAGFHCSYVRLLVDRSTV